jgi:hypothetical protein
MAQKRTEEKQAETMKEWSNKQDWLGDYLRAEQK